MRLLHLIFAGIVAAALAICLVAAGQSHSTTDLRKLRHHARVLLVFAPQAEDARVKQQLAEMRANAAGVAERQLVVIPVLQHGDLQAELSLAGSEARSLRQRFQVRDGQFLVVLVGKDGGEKLRSEKVLGFERLRAVIDAMPMRQQEARQQHMLEQR